MTDDRTDESETEVTDSSQVDDGGAETDVDGSTADSETTKPGGLDTPGGGPRKVVSSTSVDDILESLNSTPDAGERSEDESETATQHRGETDVSGADDSEYEGRVTASDSGSGDDSPTELTFDEDETPAVEQSQDGATRGEESARDAETLESDPEPERGAERTGVDDAASSLRTHLEGDAVSGADVRAAEHGAGRETTPEIDEIDLSLEDLEGSSTVPSPSSTRPTSSGSGDGPLAGRIDSGAPVHQDRTLEEGGDDGETEAGTENGGSENEDGDESAGGLLSRLRGLFSR